MANHSPMHERSGTKLSNDFPGLATIDSQAPEEGAAQTWDSETDHLLSYFLGDQNIVGHGSGTTPSFQDYTSMPPPAAPSSTTYVSSLDDIAAPRTPAMQFYSPSSSSQPQQQRATNRGRATTSSVSTSSLHAPSSTHYIHPHSRPPVGAAPSVVFSDHTPVSTMAFSLVTGGVGVAPLSRQPASSLQGEDSPISPAQLIGSGQENLMLPTDSRSSTRSSVSVHNLQNQHPHSRHRGQEGHLEWLMHINTMAKSATMQQHRQPQQQPQPQPPQQHPPTTVHPTTLHTTIAQQAPPPAPLSIPVQGFHQTLGHPGAPTQTVLFAPTTLSHIHHQAAQSAVESEEKRARRLERNRESARKSRRRKKERLATMGNKVDKLHNQIEVERKKQINSMTAALRRFRQEEMSKLKFKGYEGGDHGNLLLHDFLEIVQESGIGSPASQAVVDFQYTMLRQYLLPRYQKYLLWMTLQPETYFTAGKEEYLKRDGKPAIRISSGRVSSKQIGDELTNGWKTEGKGEAVILDKDDPDSGDRSNPTSRSMDAARMWPLFCFELGVSVDQEEKILQALKKLRHFEQLPNYRAQLAAAMRMASSLREAVLTQCRQVSQREETCYRSILTPHQSVLYQEWLSANSDRCKRILVRKHEQPVSSKEFSLFDLCNRLDEVLRISKSDNGFNGV